VNRVLWVLQVVFGLYFVAVGVMHFIVPDGLPAQMEWMYELSDTLHTLAGIAEILGGLGLILPAVTGIRPELTSYAAFGLALVMIAAIFWHVGRSEWTQIGFNVVNAAVLAFIGYGRMRLHPIGARSS
jgi:uncharacterized membrane protein